LSYANGAVFTLNKEYDWKEDWKGGPGVLCQGAVGGEKALSREHLGTHRSGRGKSKKRCEKKKKKLQKKSWLKYLVKDHLPTEIGVAQSLRKRDLNAWGTKKTDAHVNTWGEGRTMPKEGEMVTNPA